MEYVERARAPKTGAILRSPRLCTLVSVECKGVTLAAQATLAIEAGLISTVAHRQEQSWERSRSTSNLAEVHDVAELLGNYLIGVDPFT